MFHFCFLFNRFYGPLQMSARKKQVYCLAPRNLSFLSILICSPFARNILTIWAGYCNHERKQAGSKNRVHLGVKISTMCWLFSGEVSYRLGRRLSGISVVEIFVTFAEISVVLDISFFARNKIVGKKWQKNGFTAFRVKEMTANEWEIAGAEGQIDELTTF